MTIKYLFLLPLMLICAQAISQTKQLQAVKTSQPPKIDGSLDDPAWQSAVVATEFIQNFPQTGQPASAKTEVRILYDNNAIYIGAKMFDKPDLIRKQITSRDGEAKADADYFSVFFDTYKDGQNGFQFLVTPSNVQTDAKMAANQQLDYGEYGDKTWEAVWQSKTSIVEDGWIAEIRVPYISLRFAKKEVQEWGLQLLRFMRRNNESSFWNFVDPNVNGFVNQFGVLGNIVDVQPPLRLSFSPYLSGGVNISPYGNSQKTEWLKSGGVDLKYGINESFTLDASIIPDFGQVVSDNVVNNLTPYEIRFAENRPFFTEGTELFAKAGLFYSRRIGGTPQKFRTVQRFASPSSDYEIIENPAVTNLYNALKFSGRNKNKLGIAVLNAIAQKEYAVVRNKTTGRDSTIVTEPLTNYNVFVLDQAMKNRSYITFTNTNVLREGIEKDANVSALDFSFFDKKNIFNTRGAVRYSKVAGTGGYDGYSSFLRMGKVSGKIQYFVQNTIETDKYDPNDLGILPANNEVTYTGKASYNQNKPKGKFLTYIYSVSANYGLLYKPYVYTHLRLNADGFWVFRNFWDVRLSLGSLPRGEHDYFVLNTPGRFVKRPAWSYASLEGSSDSRKKLFVSYKFLQGYFHNDREHDYHLLSMGMRYRFSNKISMEISAKEEIETEYIVYVARQSNGQPLVAFVDFTDITSIFSGIYNFNSRTNLTMRVRHNWSKVLYNRIANVTAAGEPVTNNNLSYLILGLNQNENFFNLDAFFTWDFRLGSRLVLGWKNFLGSQESVNGYENFDYFSNLGKLLGLRHGNEVTLRFIYFLDYNQLKRKR